LLTPQLGDTTITVFRQHDEASQVATVIVRGSTGMFLL
jgi:hypothetical protein